MAQAPTNIYPLVVFDMHKRIREYIDRLKETGQIDLDDNGYPYLLKIDGSGSNFTVYIVRNGQQESFIMNTRKRQEPVTTWNSSDGYQHKAQKQQVKFQSNAPKDRNERAKRESYNNIVDNILK